MEVRIEPSWKEALQEEFDKEYFKELSGFVKNEYISTTVYPNPKFIFNAFELCPFDKVSVVILGQDPYHGPGQAHGLCFSVPENIAMPPSLKNIYKEIVSDVGGVIPSHGNLEHWARQGVLLLNATLTVRKGEAGSHQHKGWEEFTDAGIRTLSEKKENLVFILWGNYARAKRVLINENKHLILEAAHPSPFSAYNGFFGCKHFSKTNEYLEDHGKDPILWLGE
jgi:uracil-DNA glycosylase